MKVKTQHNSKGSVLLIVVLAIVLFAVVGLGLLKLSSNANKITVNERDDQTIFYFAESGVNLEKTKVTKLVKELDTEIKEEFNNKDFADQEAILTEHGSIESYYYKQLAEKFCEAYNTAYKTECKSTYSLTKQFSKQPMARTKVSISNDGKITITSTGYFDEAKSKVRSVKQELKVSTNISLNGSENNNEGSGENGGSGGSNSGNSGNSSPFDGFAAIAKGHISTTEGTLIDGTAGSMSGEITIKQIDDITGDLVTTKVNYPEWFQYDENLIKKLENKTESPTSYFKEVSSDFEKYFLPEFPDDKFANFASIPLHGDAKETLSGRSEQDYFIRNGKLYISSGDFQNIPTITLTEATRLTSFTIANNGAININIGSNDIDLYVDELNINGKINIIGTGTLNIYTKKITDISSSTEINTNEPRSPYQFNIYYNGAPNLTFAGGAQINGSIHIGNKTTKITLKEGFTFKGNIYSNGPEVNITGGGSSDGQWIVAPNAKIQLVEGGNVKGVVVGDTISLTGGTKIIYTEPVVPNPALPPKSTQHTLETNTDDPLLDGDLVEVDKDEDE